MEETFTSICEELKGKIHCYVYRTVNEREYYIILNVEERKMKLTFHSPVIPEDQDILYCLVCDGQGAYRNDYKFVLWCSEYGRNDDSIKEMKVFNKILTQTKKFKNLVGDQIFTRLMLCEMDY